MKAELSRFADGWAVGVREKKVLSRMNLDSLARVTEDGVAASEVGSCLFWPLSTFPGPQQPPDWLSTSSLTSLQPVFPVTAPP